MTFPSSGNLFGLITREDGTQYRDPISSVLLKASTSLMFLPWEARDKVDIDLLSRAIGEAFSIRQEELRTLTLTPHCRQEG